MVHEVARIRTMLCHHHWSRIIGCCSSRRGIAVAAHLHTEAMLAALEASVVVGASLGTSGDSNKAPTVELASKRRVLGLFVKVFRQHIRFEVLLAVDHESTAVWKPANDVGVLLVVEDLHELLNTYIVDRCQW